MHKRTAKFWEYNDGWNILSKQNLHNPWGYSRELLEYMAYYYNDWENIEVSFNLTTDGRNKLITVKATIEQYKEALQLLKNKNRGRVLD